MIEVYTDGSCKGNGQEENIGGNGFIIIHNNNLHDYKTYVNKNTTNNREELKGMINCLKYLSSINLIENIHIYTDSQYVVKGTTIWSKTWKKNNWKRGKKSTQDVKNVDLWVDLYNLYQEINPNIQWVRGHNANKWNETIDRLINEDIAFG